MQLKKPLLPLLAAILLLNPLFSSAQNFTLSGTIKDAKNGEDLIGAIAVVKENTSKGTVTNTYGFYSLTLPAGKYTIIYQFIGYNMQEVAINLDKNISKNIQLAPSANETKTVEIHGERKDKNIQNTQMSVVTITPKEIENIPVLFGEKDVMKTLQLTPGVKSAGEGNAGFYVRGGGTDQNLILLDEAPVYNASHLLGFFSVFNSDALKEVTLYKGGMPAEFGGRASSVMDVKMKDGNSKNYSLSGGIGLISSRLTLEGPIVKEKGSFIISARRTYADAFLVFSNDTNLRKASLYFYDLNLKANYQITEKDRIYLSGYFGQDVFGLAAFGFNWGNTTATLRWNHIINSQMFSNTSLIYSNYAYQIAVAFTGFSFKINSSIQDFNLKQDFSYFINPDNKMKFGFGLIHHTFRPTRLSGTGINFNDALINKYALEGGLYVQNDQRVTDLLSLQYGLRYSMFDYLGEGVAYTYDKDGNVTDSKSYKNGESIKYHGGFEPRLSAKYLLNEFSSVKASVGRNYQYLHLLSNSTTSSPTDIWVPSTNNVKPQYADQVSVGYFRNFMDDMIECSVEGYYKKLYNQIDYKNGAQLFFNKDVESELEYGKGKAYGAEFYVHKQSGKLTGWVSYTLARSLRQFDNISNGEWYSARQDIIHDLAIVAIYSINDHWKISANWVFSTGSAVTFPSGKYIVNNTLVPYYTERNGYRMPSYNRLDVGATWIVKKTEKLESSWNFSCYNAYGRQNAYSIAFQQNKDNPLQNEALQTSLFRWVPSVSYNFKF